MTAGGLSSGTYLVLRELAGADAPIAVIALAERLHGHPQEVADLCGRLVQEGLAETRPNGVAVSDAGRERVARVDEDANAAIRDYVLERPHTATVYGLVAAMQTGRFTVVDLLQFIAEGPGGSEEES